MPIFDRDGREVIRILDNQGREIEAVYDQNGVIVYKNVTTIIGTSPMQFKALGLPLKDYRIYGNTIQDGTPTPEAPVDVVGCGVKTGNVMPAGEKKTVEVNGVTFSSDGNGRYHISGTASQYSSVRFNLASGFTTPTSVSNGGQGTLSLFNNLSNYNVALVFYNGSTMVDDWKMLPDNRTTTAYNLIGNKYVDSIIIAINSGETVDMTIMPEFTNDGILPSEFEPYGYKLPVTTTNGTDTVTTPIYIGFEPLHKIGDYADYVDYSRGKIVRRIKKLVLTGNENWILYTLPDAVNVERFYFILSQSAVNASPYSLVSSHFPIKSDNSDMEHMRCGGSSNNEMYIYIPRLLATTVAGLKSYLAAQYAAGTPVTVWYVLQEPIEEDPPVPFPGLPTLTGTNTLTVDTTVKPSEIDLTGRIRTSG